MPLTLTGHLVELRPLERSHHDALEDALHDGTLWETAWYTSVPTPAGLAAEIDRRLDLLDRGEMIPFTAFDTSGRALGMTTFCNLVARVPRLEIGYTWNRASAHGTGTNPESKLLLLSHAFETLGAVAVSFVTAWLNFQSRAAIERLGAKQEGVLRAVGRYRDGSLRDSVHYSVIEPEWPAVKSHLEARLSKRR